MIRNGMCADEVKNLFNIRGRESPWEEIVTIKISIIRPDAPLGGGPGGLSFDPVAMREMIKKGQAGADNFIASLDPGDITWA